MIRQTNTLLLILVSFLLAYWIRFDGMPLPQNYIMALLLALFLSAVIIPASGAYRQEFEWQFLRKLRLMLGAWLVVVLCLVGIAAMLKLTADYSRIWFGTWVLMTCFGLVGLVYLSHMVSVRRRTGGKDSRNIVLIGSGRIAQKLESQILNDPVSGLNLLGCFGEYKSSQELQQMDDLLGFIQSSAVQDVWIAVPWDQQGLLELSLERLREAVVNVVVVPDFEQYRLLNQSISEWNGLPIISLAGTGISDSEFRLKLIIDWVISLALVVLLAPIILIIAAAIFLEDRSPVFFRQIRLGLDGQEIRTLKFRTMKSHSSNQKFRQAVANDDRVTTVGRFLRKTSLDELPQLFNVLAGEMSLVGPRPHPLELNEAFKSRIPKYMLRHRVKPGITGWAQVNGHRGETDTEDKMVARIEHDLWYIQNWSLWLDLKILMMTPFVMIHRNAY